ncbi:MAG: hypothetical protein SFW09_20500 [Hyphomicrobiaceae bacterium]|nr:hypothetical protein [Hyphomicrobiaceae bacterium]
MALMNARVIAALLTGSMALAVHGLASNDARAQGYRRHDGPPAYVVAESRWGNGTITGAVRPGRHGWQVRLPRGTWIDCGRSCSETLRRETVDFWQSSGPQAADSGVGYLRWDFRY